MDSKTIIDQTQIINKTTKNIETEVKNTVNNINVDLSKLDMSVAIDSFKQLEQVSQAANFDVFIQKVLALKDAFSVFQKSVQTANTSVTNFSKSADKLSGANTAIVTNVEVDTSDTTVQIGELTSEVSMAATAIGNGFASAGNGVANAANGISAAASSISACFDSIGSAAESFGSGIATAATGVSTLIDSISGLATGFATACTGIQSAASGISMLIPLLPALGTSIMAMAVNMDGVLAYIPELLAFAAVLTVIALLGEGLNAAGTGLINIGLGLTSMMEGMQALIEFMPVFIASLAGITDNIGGIITFVLLAAAMMVMAIALQMINEQMTTFVDSMEKLQGLVSVGFVAAFAVFAVMLIAMSAFMEKAAKGMDKVTKSMEKQAAKLAILNPLLAVQAVLTNPIVGAITVAAAVACGLIVGAVFPAMATGGVVSSPTMALVGEGKYPEAVVPLGSSPQFASMKSDIANAVVQAIHMSGEGKKQTSGVSENITLNIDGKTFARLILPELRKESSRHGYDMAVKGV